MFKNKKYNKTIDLSEIVLSDISYLKEQNKSLITSLNDIFKEFHENQLSLLYINDILNSCNTYKVKIQKINKIINKYFKDKEQI